MVDRLVQVWLIDEGVRGRDSLFEVTVLLTDGDTDALKAGQRNAWRSTLRRAHKMIREHVAQRRLALGIDELE